jgi:hypothetical protein
MAPDPKTIREVMTLAERLDREWMRKVPETDRRYLPWMPFPVPAFLALVLEALPSTPSGNRFLGIGAGIGTKELLAREICGLDVTLIERVPEYAAQAETLGLADIWTGDALDFPSYGSFDLLWLHRPMRDPDMEMALERKVYTGMAPGAVIIGAALETQPPTSGFWPVLEDFEDVRRGIWYKISRPS